MKRIYRTKFVATHYIKDHKRCGQKHSHQYELKVLLEFNDATKWVDFHEIKDKVIQALVDTGIVDHTENFLGHMTCEELADLIHKNIYMGTVNMRVKNIQIELYETEHFGVLFP